MRPILKISGNLMLWNLIIVIPSFRFFLKFLNIYFLVFYIVIANLVFVFWKKLELLKVIKTPIWLGFCVLISIANFYIYPLANARSQTANSGSTGDDAMIIAANTLKTSAKLYDVTINQLAPISPGPGWILLNSGFVLGNIYFLLTPFYIFLLGFFIKKYNQISTANLFLIFFSISAVFWELLFNGHDIVAFSIALFLILLIVFQVLRQKYTPEKAILIGIILGLVSTSRIIFIFYPFFIFLLLYEVQKKNSYLLLISSVGINLILNVYFFIVNDYFQPLHIFFKAKRILGIELILILTLFIAIFLYYFIKQKKYFQDWFFKAFILFSLLFIPIVYSDLIRINFEFSKWEGANYIVPLIPFYLFLILTKPKYYFFNPNSL